MKNISEKMVSWRNYYIFAAIAALLIVVVGLVDSVTSMSAGEAQANNAIGVQDWFALFQSNRLSALGNLGLFNILTLSLGVPVYLALYNIHRQSLPSLAALAAVLFVMGTAIYLSSNTVFSMLALSEQYAVASGEQKLLLEGAGRALLAQGADLTPGTYMGFFFTQIAGMLMAIVLMRGGVFGKIAGWLGTVGFGVMLIFFTIAAFAPSHFNTAILISAPGGLLLIAYQILLARKLFQLARKEA
jgi:hypothetical protein